MRHFQQVFDKFRQTIRLALDLGQEVVVCLDVPGAVSGPQCADEAFDVAQWSAQLVRGGCHKLCAVLHRLLHGCAKSRVFDGRCAASREALGKRELGGAIATILILRGKGQRTDRVASNPQRHNQQSGETKLL